MKKKLGITKRQWFSLLIVLVLALVLRLYKIGIPLADHHSWRQADSAAVIRNLGTKNFDLFRPQWNNLVPTNSQGLPNPNRYFFEDFPLAYDVYPAFLYRIFGVEEMLARLVSVTFSLGTIFFLFLLVKLLINYRVAILSVLFYAMLPFSVFYSRTILQEPAMMFYLIGAFYFLAVWSLKKETAFFYYLSALFFAFSLLSKAYSLFFTPLLVYFFWRKDGMGMIKKKKFYLYFLISFLPFSIWWFWISKHPEGLPYSGWLLNEGNIRFKGAWFYWLFAERIGKLILGYWGLFLFSLGLIIKTNREKYFFHLWFFCVVVFFTVFAKGNVTHDYYQFSFLPLASVFLAKGVDFLLKAPSQHFSRLLIYPTLVIVVLYMLAFSWYFVRDFYNLKGGVDLAGMAVEEMTLPDSLVIAGDGADPSLLYNTNRNGWVVGFGALMENSPETIKELKGKGANYYVTTKVNELKNSGFGFHMSQNFSVVKETDQFILYDLKTK